VGRRGGYGTSPEAALARLAESLKWPQQGWNLLRDSPTTKRYRLGPRDVLVSREDRGWYASSWQSPEQSGAAAPFRDVGEDPRWLRTLRRLWT